MKPYNNPFWGFNNGTPNPINKMNNLPKIVATFISASSQGQRMHSARTNIPKIVATYVYASSQGQRTHSARTKNYVLSGVRKCIHNVHKKNTGHELNKKGNKTGKIKEPGKDTNCPAEINFSISAPCDLACGNKKTDVQYMRDKFPLKIKLYFNHNHSIHSADALRFRPVSDETKKLLTDLFDEDVSPSSAHRRVLDYFENESADFTADRFHIPDYKWVFNFHAKYIKNKFGSSNGVDVIKKLKDTIAKYNTERGEKLAEVKQTASGETIVAICDSFNRRVHENIPAAGDMLIMDTTANLYMNDTNVRQPEFRNSNVHTYLGKKIHNFKEFDTYI